MCLAFQDELKQAIQDCKPLMHQVSTTGKNGNLQKNKAASNAICTRALQKSTCSLLAQPLRVRTNLLAECISELTPFWGWLEVASSKARSLFLRRYCAQRFMQIREVCGKEKMRYTGSESHCIDPTKGGMSVGSTVIPLTRKFKEKIIGDTVAQRNCSARIGVKLPGHCPSGRAQHVDDVVTYYTTASWQVLCMHWCETTQPCPSRRAKHAEDFATNYPLYPDTWPVRTGVKPGDLRSCTGLSAIIRGRTYLKGVVGQAS
eukprot:1151985-Pelagomonas_calceolata.AAC.1